MLDSILFYLFATAAIVSAALMITRRDAIHSAVFLVTTLLATAGIFLQLRAEFLFAAQILLYAGGVTTLFVFVILLTRGNVAVSETRFTTQKIVAGGVTAALGLQVAFIFVGVGRSPAAALFISGIAPAEKLPPNSEELAKGIFGSYLLPFEITGILLLIAMVGAILMARNKETDG